MSNDVVLVAPRPVRINSLPASQRPTLRPSRLVSTPNDAFARIKLSDDDEVIKDDLPPSPGRNSVSPRTSPRLNSSADVLEEFLSILRPSLFPTGPQTLRSRRHGATSVPLFPYERPHPYKTKTKSHSKSSSVSSTGSDDSDYKRSGRSASPLHSPVLEPSVEDDSEQVAVINLDLRQPGILESPISRNHTRNPFQRHPSYEMPFASIFTTHPSPSLMPLPPSPTSYVSYTSDPIPYPMHSDDMETS